MPLVMPLMAVALIMMRSTRERRLHPGRLWIAPFCFTALVATALYLTPHPPFSMEADEAMVFAVASGLAFGTWRAQATVLRHEPGTGRIMASQSNIAAAVLAAVFLLRTMVREQFGAHTVLVTNMSMLFAVGMIVALQSALWHRARGLTLSQPRRAGAL